MMVPILKNSVENTYYFLKYVLTREYYWHNVIVIVSWSKMRQQIWLFFLLIVDKNEYISWSLWPKANENKLKNENKI